MSSSLPGITTRLRHTIVAGICLSCGISAASAASSEAVIGWFDTLEVACIDRANDVVHTQELRPADFDALGRTSMRTDLRFIDGPARFSGVPLNTLAGLCERRGLSVDHAVASALNDYEATIPARDWRTYDVLVADRRDGERMPVVDKGPYWIVYPVTAHGELDVARYLQRMVWQLSRIEFRESP